MLQRAVLAAATGRKAGMDGCVDGWIKVQSAIWCRDPFKPHSDFTSATDANRNSRSPSPSIHLLEYPGTNYVLSSPRKHTPVACASSPSPHNAVKWKIPVTKDKKKRPPKTSTYVWRCATCVRNRQPGGGDKDLPAAST